MDRVRYNSRLTITILIDMQIVSSWPCCIPPTRTRWCDTQMKYVTTLWDIFSTSLTCASWRVKRWSSVDGLLTWILCPHSNIMPAYRSQMGSSQACGCSRFRKTCSDIYLQNSNWVWRLIVQKFEVFCFTRGRNGVELCLTFWIDWHGDCKNGGWARGVCCVIINDHDVFLARWPKIRTEESNPRGRAAKNLPTQRHVEWNGNAVVCFIH